MFLKYSNLIEKQTITNLEACENPPTANYVEITTPVKAKVGSKSGIYLLSNYFESIYYRMKDAKKLNDTHINKIYDKAKELDASDGVEFNDLTEYPTLYNSMLALCKLNYINKNEIIIVNKIDSIKQYAFKNR